MTPNIISPTGKGIRSDKAGDGSYGASRGNRIHQGVDFICTPGQDVVCPIDNALFVRVAYPYADISYDGCLLRNEFMEVMMFYVEPIEGIVGKTLRQGDKIGVAQNIADRYSDNMTPHIHLDIRSTDPLLFMEGVKL